ncbi:ATP-grasp domain-containing protein [Flagellimonas marinaquae]
MQIAIHKNNAGFTKRWISYCEKEKIPFKLVDAYAPSFLEDLEGCDAFMWHLSHENHKDVLAGYSVMKSLEEKGIVVYPTPNQLWHFDDKLAQSYFFKCHGIPFPETRVIFSLKEGGSFLNGASFPMIAKLKRGSASSNVFLLKNIRQARQVLKKSFRQGYPLYNLKSKYGDRLKKAKGFKERLELLLKYVYRMLKPPEYSRYLGREKGYLLLQEFIPNQGFDVRVVVVGDRLVALKRLVRTQDFRASGSGKLEYPNENLKEDYRKLAFHVIDLLNVPAMGFDFMEDKEGKIYLIEMSYGFPSENFLDGASGYWTADNQFVKSDIQLQEWMIDRTIDRIEQTKNRKR